MCGKEKYGTYRDDFLRFCGKFFDINTKEEIDKASIELPLGDHKVGSYRIERNYHVGICEYCNRPLESESHSYTEHNPLDNLVIEPATCSSHGTYYVSCICGKSSAGTMYEDYFVDENGKYGDHKYIYHDVVLPHDDEDGTDEYYSCEYCSKLFDTSKNEISSPNKIPNTSKIIIQNKLKGQEIDLLYKQARDYLNSDNPAQYLINASSSAGDHTDGIKLTWIVNGANGTSTLEMATDSEFENIILSYPNLSKYVNEMTIYNLEPKTYYYRINNPEYISNYDYFTIKGNVRTINTNNRIINMRDIGGYQTESGAFVKYGKLFRSAYWDNADSTTDIRLKGLGIKTELDIRRSSGSNDYSASKHPINGVNFVNLGIGQYTQVVPNAYSYYVGAMENIDDIFALLSNEENYPLTFHCTAGADRTGTLAFLILGLLGVDYENICQDFELTTFYNSRRWRSNIIDNNGTYEFDDTGVMQNDSNNYVAFNALYDAMMTRYGGQDNKLSTAITNYLTTACNVNASVLEQVKNIMLEETN